MPNFVLGRAGAILIVLLAGLCGCAQPYRDNVEPLTVTYEQGDYPQAAQSAGVALQSAEKNHKRDVLMFLLEHGSTTLTAANYDDCRISLDRADVMFDDIDRAARLRFSREGLAVLTNPAALAYEGYGYDRIMMNVYKSLACLQAGAFDDARVEIRRIMDSQAKCEERYRDRIRQAKAASAQARAERNVSFDYDEAEKNPRYRGSRQRLLREFPEIEEEAPLDDLSHKQVYTNPYAEYLQGLFYLYSGAPGDQEIGRVALRNAAGMRRNRYLLEDAAFAEKAASAGSTPPRVFVIFESGMAPRRVEYRIDVPVFLFNIAVHDTKIDYVGIAIPGLQRVGGDHPYLLVTAGEMGMESEILSDMDQIVAREFKNELPLIITRAAISAAVKLAIQYATAKATENEDPLVQIVARGLATAYTAATNQADTRTWRTLPKNIQLVSFDPPADGVVRLDLPGGRPLTTLNVDPNRATVIWVRCPSVMAPAVIKQFALN